MSELMDEYIKRRDAVAAIHDSNMISPIDQIEGGNAILMVPAADVVPVIRCENCAFYEVAYYGDAYTKNVCRLLNRQIQDDDFCSYALPKGEATMDGEAE